MPFILNQSHAITYLANWYKEHPDYNGFTRGALEAIADYLDETETTMEVDPIQLACEWEEFESLEALREHCSDYTGYPSDADDETLLEWVNEQTTCLSLPRWRGRAERAHAIEPFEYGTQTRYVLVQF
jgi:hypothetical protein